MLRRIPIPTAVSLLAILLAVTAIVVQLPPLLSAMLSSSPAGDDPGEVIARFVEEHEENQQIDRERFNGRSLFYPPQSWPRPPTDVRPPPPKRQTRVEEPPPTTPAPPPTPTVYQGPSVNFALGNEIWFMGAGPGQEPFRVRVGEEMNGVKVIATDLPWTVKLGYRGGEFDVGLLEKTDGFISDSAPDVTGSTDLIRFSNPEDGDETVARATPPDGESERAGEEEVEKDDLPVVKPRNPLRPAPVRAENAAKDGASRPLPLDRVRQRAQPTARPAKSDKIDKSLSDASDASDKYLPDPAEEMDGEPAAS